MRVSHLANIVVAPMWAADSFNSLVVMLAAGVGLHRQRGY
jgi:hypothetical protein